MADSVLFMVAPCSWQGTRPLGTFSLVDGPTVRPPPYAICSGASTSSLRAPWEDGVTARVGGPAPNSDAPHRAEEGHYRLIVLWIVGAAIAVILVLVLLGSVTTNS